MLHGKSEAGSAEEGGAEGRLEERGDKSQLLLPAIFVVVAPVRRRPLSLPLERALERWR